MIRCQQYDEVTSHSCSHELWIELHSFLTYFLEKIRKLLEKSENVSKNENMNLISIVEWLSVAKFSDTSRKLDFLYYRPWKIRKEKKSYIIFYDGMSLQRKQLPSWWEWAWSIRLKSQWRLILFEKGLLGPS